MAWNLLKPTISFLSASIALPSWCIRNRSFIHWWNFAITPPWLSLARQTCAFQLGRASCRERGCQYVSIPVVAVSLTNKTTTNPYQLVNIRVFTDDQHIQHITYYIIPIT